MQIISRRQFSNGLLAGAISVASGVLLKVTANESLVRDFKVGDVVYFGNKTNIGIIKGVFNVKINPQSITILDTEYPGWQDKNLFTIYPVSSRGKYIVPLDGIRHVDGHIARRIISNFDMLKTRNKQSWRLWSTQWDEKGVGCCFTYYPSTDGDVNSIQF